MTFLVDKATSAYHEMNQKLHSVVDPFWQKHGGDVKCASAVIFGTAAVIGAVALAILGLCALGASAPAAVPAVFGLLFLGATLVPFGICLKSAAERSNIVSLS